MAKLTAYEQQMLALREREVAALESLAKTEAERELRNGPSNYRIPGTGSLGLGHGGGRWVHGVPDRYRN